MKLVILLFAIVLCSVVTSVALLARVFAMHRELGRTRRRMLRLDEIADDVAEREAVASFEVVPEPEPRAPQIKLLRDAALYQPIGPETPGDADDDFAAPRMAVRNRVQHPARERNDTAVGSPRRLMPRERHPTVAVGSILVKVE